MKKFIRTYRFILSGIMLLLILSSCQSFWLEQRYNNLKKVAVNARTETDTICNHVSKALFDSPAGTLMVQNSNTDSASMSRVNAGQPNVRLPSFTTVKNVAKYESMRLAQKYSVPSSDYRCNGEMAVRNTQIWWLWGVLIFITAFMIAVALIRWVSKSDSGCLILGSWLLATGLLTWLLLWLIL